MWMNKKPNLRISVFFSIPKTLILMRSLWVCIRKSYRANVFCVYRNNACNVRFLYSVYIKYINIYTLLIHLTTDVGCWCGCCFCLRCLVHDFVRLFMFTFQWASQTNVWHAYTKFLYSFFSPYYIYGSFFSFPLLLAYVIFFHQVDISNAQHFIFEFLMNEIL